MNRLLARTKAALTAASNGQWQDVAVNLFGGLFTEVIDAAGDRLQIDAAAGSARTTLYTAAGVEIASTGGANITRGLHFLPHNRLRTTLDSAQAAGTLEPPIGTATGMVGASVVTPDTIPEQLTRGVQANQVIAAGAEVVMVSAPGAGLRLRISSVVITFKTVAALSDWELRDGAGGAAMLESAQGAVAAGSPQTVIKDWRPAVRLGANNALVFRPSAAIALVSLNAYGWIER